MSDEPVDQPLAKGGPVQPGKLYLIGETGCDLIIPVPRAS